MFKNDADVLILCYYGECLAIRCDCGWGVWWPVDVVEVHNNCFVSVNEEMPVFQPNSGRPHTYL